MPDLERITDEFFFDIAITPEEKAWMKGYIYGKSYARKEFFCVTAILVCLVLVVIAVLCN